ncbi:hypothetical protein J3P71_14680 [Rhizobium leguminosarum]|uniref:hypothetical protein n=1 Tax=Rhizobium leguminosarum TaxID=384 RepID=UPI001442851B|nr:hypothetical protein [Rhizobium leguminosarum]MBY5841502.1 hypothetical protein [Rhizobium leguminosarum]NKM81762.1 hypothetical protein [Rhizobium leguminosarum bv. viciae]QSZ06150.1 hypothetical protein J3P71_14680 [Rhizobium leguminosarum]
MITPRLRVQLSRFLAARFDDYQFDRHGDLIQIKAPLFGRALSGRHFDMGDRDGISGLDSDGFFVAAAGRVFRRSIVSRFDACPGAGKGRHSIAV